MARYSPFAPLTPRAQRRKARTLVNSQILPLLAQLNAEFARRDRAGSSAIAGGTNALVSALAPLASQTHATYSAAEAQQRADDAALADRLTRVGGETAATLRAQLQQAGQGAEASRHAAEATTQGAGAGAASAAMGSAALARLLAEGSAAEAYSGQLPGIARMGGAQRLAQFSGQLASERATQAGQLRSKIPGLLSQVQQQIQDQEFQKAVAVQSGLVNQQKLQLDTAYKQARIGQGQQAINLRAAKQRTDSLYKAAGLDIKNKQYRLSVQREHRLERTKGGKSGGFTPSQISNYRATAIDTVKDWKHGVPASHYANGDVKNAGQKGRPRDPRGAFRFLVNHGIPPSIADWAVGQVYGRWKAPGERANRGIGGTGPR